MEVDILKPRRIAEFADEIDGWVISELKRVGFDTARSIITADRADLIRRTELEEETIDDVIRVVQQELEEE